MMLWWTEVLPFFLVKWWIKRHGEVFHRYGRWYVSPRPGVEIDVEPPPEARTGGVDTYRSGRSS